MAERPDWNALYSAFEELGRAFRGMADTQRKIMQVTGRGSSPDGTVKAVVGPRGHLIELELDQKVYRKPNSKALAASILAAVRAAVEDASGKTRELLDLGVPNDLRVDQVGSLNIRGLMEVHDSELLSGGR